MRQEDALVSWYASDGDNTLSVDYPLNPESLVFEVGGYLGDWTDKIVRRYNPRVYVFEPVQSSYVSLVKRFSDSPKVKIFNFGLAAEDDVADINENQDSSSLYRSGGSLEPVFIRSIAEFIERDLITKIDLISINCEGGEYAILSSLLDSGFVNLCDNIQVQFHSDYPDAVNLRDRIRERLKQTHEESYNYSFVWESWKRKIV